jgi:hypothetical protein
MDSRRRMIKTRVIKECSYCKSPFAKLGGTNIFPKCPECGISTDDILIGHVPNFLRIEKWESTAVWYKPWTRGNGYWVSHDGTIE